MQAQLAMRLRRWHANHNSFCAIPTEALLREAQALDDARADLPHFAAYGMAVTAHHFDALAVLTAALEHCAQQRLVRKAEQARAQKLWSECRRTLRAHLSVLAARARLDGLARALCTLGPATGNPLWQVEVARRQAERWQAWLDAAPALTTAEGLAEPPRAAGGLARTTTALQGALAAAGAVAESLDALQVELAGLRSDEAALKCLLRDDLTALAHWGRTLRGATGEALGDYQLRRLRRATKKVKEPAVGPAVAEG